MNDLFERVRSRVPFHFCCKARRRAPCCWKRFKNTEAAVLFATASFWQGVDVPGEQLSCVIVDRLPFAVPSDPIVGGASARFTGRWAHPFAEFQVPQASLR